MDVGNRKKEKERENKSISQTEPIEKVAIHFVTIVPNGIPEKFSQVFP